MNIPIGSSASITCVSEVKYKALYQHNVWQPWPEENARIDDESLLSEEYNVKDAQVL